MNAKHSTSPNRVVVYIILQYTTHSRCYLLMRCLTYFGKARNRIAHQTLRAVRTMTSCMSPFRPLLVRTLLRKKSALRRRCRKTPFRGSKSNHNFVVCRMKVFLKEIKTNGDLRLLYCTVLKCSAVYVRVYSQISEKPYSDTLHSNQYIECGAIANRCRPINLDSQISLSSNIQLLHAYIATGVIH